MHIFHIYVHARRGTQKYRRNGALGVRVILLDEISIISVLNPNYYRMFYICFLEL